MSKYANPNTEEFINKLLKNAKSYYDNEIYEFFWSTLMNEIEEDSDNYKETFKLIDQYKDNAEIREGVDLTFIALTGYSLGTLLENAIEDYDKKQ